MPLAIDAALSRSAVGAILLAMAALALAAAFVDQHRAELASVSASARAFAVVLRTHGLWSLSGVGQSAAGAAAAMLVVLSWYGVGATLLGALRSAGEPVSTLRPRPSPALDVASACAFGAGVWSLLWFALGLAGLYRPAMALLALACGTALGARAILRTGTTSGRPRDGQPARSPLAFVAALLAGLPVALAFVAALAPPTAKDTLQYHLSLPRAFVAGGGLVNVPDSIASYFPLGAEMHGVWAMLAGGIVSPRTGEAAFGAVLFAFFPLLLAAVFGWARESGLGRDWAWLAAAMVAGVPTAFEVAGSGYVDLALALYVTLAIHAAARWWDTRDRMSLVEAALALGFALSTKLTAGFVVFVLALIVLLRLRRTDPADPRRDESLAVGLAAPALAVVLGCPWYVRTWARTGSPVFPFFASVWPGHAPGWDIERSAMLVGFNALYGGAQKGLVDYLLTPLSLSLMGQREVAALYEGVLGVAFVVGVALVAWAWASGRLAPQLRIAAAAAGAFFIWWLASAQVLRYLMPALPLLAVASAGAGAALAARGQVGRSLGWTLALSVLAGELVIGAWTASDEPLLAVLGAEPRTAYLGRRLDYYAYYRVINDSLPADAKVWLVDVRRDTYHLERPWVGDYLFEDYTLRKWIEAAPTGADVQRRARAAGITHVLIRHDILFDYARSPLVDDRRPQADNLARIERLRSFLLDGTRMLRADKTFALVELASPIEPSRTGSR